MREGPTGYARRVMLTGCCNGCAHGVVVAHEAAQTPQVATAIQYLNSFAGHLLTNY